MSPKKIFILTLLMTITVGFFCFTNFALAEDFGLSATAGAAGLTKTSGSELPVLVGNMLGTALSFIGVLFFALMVFGGFMWMTARGNEEQTKKAMNSITAAVIGLVIVLSSYTITNFVFDTVGIQSSPSGGSPTVEPGPAIGSDTWCGRVDVELMGEGDSPFTPPSKWQENYTCIKIAKDSEGDSALSDVCVAGKLYAKESINRCPVTGTDLQMCCNTEKVPDGDGKYCLVKAEAGEIPECEKIGLGFEETKICVETYETGTACDAAIANGAGVTKKQGEECTETVQCSEDLTCRYVVEGEGQQSDIKQCQSKLKSGEGPCVDVVNDCEIGTSPYACLTASVASIKYKICTIPKTEGRCLEASDCAQGWECKDRVCTAMKCIIGDDSTCPVGKYCSNGNRYDDNIYDDQNCYIGNAGNPCEQDSNCKSGWCKSVGNGKDTCADKLEGGEKCTDDKECVGECGTVGVCVD